MQRTSSSDVNNNNISGKHDTCILISLIKISNRCCAVTYDIRTVQRSPSLKIPKPLRFGSFTFKLLSAYLVKCLFIFSFDSTDAMHFHCTFTVRLFEVIGKVFCTVGKAIFSIEQLVRSCLGVNLPEDSFRYLLRLG